MYRSIWLCRADHALCLPWGFRPHLPRQAASSILDLFPVACPRIPARLDCWDSYASSHNLWATSDSSLCGMKPPSSSGLKDLEHLLKVPQAKYAITVAKNVKSLSRQFIGYANHYHATWMKKKPYWAKGKKPVKVIGQHAFYKLWNNSSNSTGRSLILFAKNNHSPTGTGMFLSWPHRQKY